MIATGAGMLGIFQRLIERQAEIGRLNAVITEIDRLRASVVWAEAAYRGFVTDGSKRYLEIYYAAMHDVDDHSYRLKSMLRAHAREPSELNTLTAALEAKGAELDSGIDSGLRGDLHGAARSIREGRARTSLHEVFDALDRLGSAYRERLGLVKATHRSGVRTVYIAGAVAIIANLMLLWLLVRRVYQASDAAMEARTELASRNDELTRLLTVNSATAGHTHELSELMRYLQACHTTQEAFAVLKERLPVLVGGRGGALYGWAQSGDQLRLAVAWGERGHRELVHPDECWGLRRGQPFQQPQEGGLLACQHFHQDAGEAGVGHIECMPMMAHGEVAGLLVIEYGAPQEEGVYAGCGFSSDIRDSTLEHVALSLGNLRLRESLREQSIRDALTGVYNRRFLEEFVAREILVAGRKLTEGSCPGFAVLMLDVDHFKRVNDENGHEVGDLVLSEVARAIQRSARGSDIVARYGGEEFAVIFTDISPQQARQRAETLRSNVERLAIKGPPGCVGRVTVSIGLAHHPQDGDSFDALIAAADGALYDAKRHGRNRVAIAA